MRSSEWKDVERIEIEEIECGSPGDAVASTTNIRHNVRKSPPAIAVHRARGESEPLEIKENLVPVEPFERP